MSKSFWCRNIYSDSKWLSSQRISLNDSGIIESITPAKKPTNEDTVLTGALIPGFHNCHSHIFQYAMTGLMEHTAQDKDNFWSWRNTMYSLAQSINPEDLKAIAQVFFSEAIAHGFTSHVEFHYLHYDKNGKSYEQNSLMSECIIEAAKVTGMQLTLIPIFYNKGGFNAPIEEKQRRFYSPDRDAYIKLLEDIKSLKKTQPFLLGHGVHSLRAASLSDIKYLLNEHQPAGPIHIHIAEQMKEVEEFESLHGQRPVSWLLQNIPNRPLNLVHSTHIDQIECRALAKSHHNVVVCPTTEGNLGDGFFPLREFHLEGGNWCIGTDSNVNISPLAELVLADYGQRLVHQVRNPLLPKQGGDSGSTIFERIQKGSVLASHQSSQLVPGSGFSAVEIDLNHPNLLHKPDTRYLSSLIFSTNQQILSKTIINGSVVAEAGLHKKRQQFIQPFATTIKKLIETI